MAKYGMQTVRIIAVVMLAAVVLACGNRNGADGDDSGQNGTSGAERTTFAVNVTTAIAGSITDYIRVTGDVHPVSSVDILPDIAGELKRVHVRVGERVQQDQLIAEVDRSRPGQTFAPSPVRSTISGTVTALPVQAGSMVATGTPVARVAQTDDLEIRTAVAERFVSKMRPGMPARVRLDAYPGEQFAARVTEISPVLDPQTRTLGAKLTLNRRDTRVRPGMFAQIQLITQQKEGVVKVPADTVVRRFGETYIFVVQEDESTVERRRVRVGIEIDNVAEIVDGLQTGETIVYQGQALLEDGARIRVIDRFNVLD